jgi:sigma-E factor negative regulatory protein RseB
MPIASSKSGARSARRAVLVLSLALSGAAMPVLALAQNGAQGSDAQANAAPALSPKAAADALDRVQRASQQLDYTGTFVYQRGNYIQSSRVTHVMAKGEGDYERIESLDGQSRTVLRHDDMLYTFVPERHLCVVEHRQNKDAFPALLGASGSDVMASYTLRQAGHDRVAGLDAQVLNLVPKDANRYAYKLWTDQRSGLLLRLQTLDADGHVLEQVAFSQVQVGGVGASEKNSIAAGIHDLGGWTVARAPVEAADMATQGWQVPTSIAGFTRIRELRRPMAARDAGAPPIYVNQVVYSDGLATVSVFIEPADNNNRSEGSGGTGATHMLVKRSGDVWLTVLGEVPAGALQQFASALEYKPSK